MNVNFDHFNRAENPKLFICNPNNKILAPISVYTNLIIKPTFNGLSELSIYIYKYIKDDDIGIVDTSRVCDCYKYIALHRYIHVGNAGYFIITQLTEKSDGANPYYDIKASSCEFELNNRKLKIDAGSYKLYNPQFPSMSIMGKVLALCPSWSLGNIPDSILNTYRSFDDTNENIYSFLSNEVQKAFDCIFNFDIEKRTINAIDLNSEIDSTDIVLNYNNVVQNLDINQTADNVITALSVTGSDNLSINEVNPLGTNYIVDFSYYKNTDWMSQELIDAINVWEKKVSDNQENLNSCLATIKQHKTELEKLNNDLATLQSELKSLDDEKSNLSNENKDYSSIQTQINSKNAAIEITNNEIVAKQTTIDYDYTQLSNLQNSLKLENNLTANQYIELSNFIYENDYNNEYITADENMTYAQKQELQYALYADGLKKLKKVCQPISDFEIDCNNFLLIPEFDVFRNQFELGKIIHVETNPNNYVDMMILQYEINYDSKTLKIKVSNQMKIHDKYSAYQEVYSRATKTNNAITENKSTWDYPVKSGKIEDFEAFRTGALNATLNKVISSTNEDISIDNTGIHGRARDPSTGKLQKEEMWLNKNDILFSDDNFQTAKTALGKITLPDGSVVYGLLADAIVAGTIDASRINVNNINADNITTGIMSANRVNLSDYATIQSVEDGLEEKVSKDELSASIKESPDAVVYAFNNMENQQSIKFTGDGFDFYYNSTFLGHLGVSENTDPDSNSYAMCMQPANSQGSTYFGNSGSYAQIVMGKLKAHELHADGLIATNGFIQGTYKASDGEVGKSELLPLTFADGTKHNVIFKDGLLVSHD